MPLTDQRFDLEQILGAAQLPALPQSAIRLLELSKDPENGPVEFAVPIEADPGLTSQVLKFVNSSYFGFSREIDNVKQAITLVGVRTIKNFALWSAVFSLMPNPKRGQFRLSNLWQDSLRRALFARIVAKSLGVKDAEGPFAAALLQDLAIPMLAKEIGEPYVDLLERRGIDGRRLSSIEMDQFGWTHASAGGMIARRWNLPEQFAELIEEHADLDAVVESGDPAKLAVALSALLPASADTEWADADRFQEVYAERCAADTSEIGSVFATVDEQFKDFGPVLKLEVPSKPLRQWYAG